MFGEEAALGESTVSPDPTPADNLFSLNPSPFTDTHYLIIPGLTTLTALIQNANLLGIPCFPPRGLQIHILPGTSTPLSLSPTAIQSTILHFPLIDLISFAGMRDKILQAGSLVKGAELWKDIADVGVKIWSGQPWDNYGWEVQEAFVGRWWFLVDDGVVRRANWWRSVRGELELKIDNWSILSK